MSDFPRRTLPRRDISRRRDTRPVYRENLETGPVNLMEKQPVAEPNASR